MSTETTLMSTRSNLWLSAIMAMVVIGLIGRGLYTLHHTGDDYGITRTTII